MPASSTLRLLRGPLELIHEQAGPRLLRLTRIGILLLWLVKLLLDPLWRLADFPRELMDPIGLVRLLSPAGLESLLTPGGLTALWIALFATLVWGLTNCAFPLSATVAAILLTFYSCLIRSFGPAPHTDLVLLFAVYALAAFAWADALAVKLGKSSRAWSSYPLVTIVVLLCLSYALVGLNRLVEGGYEVFAGDSLEFWTVDASLRGYYFNTNVGWHVPEWPLVVFMLRAGFPVITLFEITAPLCLVSSHYRWIFIPTMLSFHLMSLVFMNIFFYENMLLYLLLIDWSRKFPSLRQS